MPTLFFRARLWFLLCIVFSYLLAALVIFTRPELAPLMGYKLVLIPFGGLAGYILDRVIFRYADPSSYLHHDWRKNPDADLPGEADYPVAPGYMTAFLVAQLRQMSLVAVGMFVAGVAL